MSVDTLMSVDMKGAAVFWKKHPPKTVCDNLCRAAKVREDTLFKAAQQGPRF
jgi:hypothetical protein